MNRSRVFDPSDLVAAQTEVDRAGWAWACRYSSSDEFEAAVIRARRRAGAYGATRRRYILYAGVAAGLLALVTLLIALVR